MGKTHIIATLYIQDRWGVNPGPVPEIIPGPLQVKFNFSNAQI